MAAIGVLGCREFGHLRHVQAQELWLQKKVREGRVDLVKTSAIGSVPSRSALWSPTRTMETSSAISIRGRADILPRSLTPCPCILCWPSGVHRIQGSMDASP